MINCPNHQKGNPKMPDPDQLTKHFCRSEFACGDACGFNTVDIGLLAILETIRAHFNAPVIIRSGARCSSHNTSEGGAPESQHLYGKAADIVVSGIAADLVQDFIDASFPDSLGMGRYALFTHIDCRDVMARWENGS
jgi:uncharacterized protein YcbK (DUF882 family)